MNLKFKLFNFKATRVNEMLSYFYNDNKAIFKYSIGSNDSINSIKIKLNKRIYLLINYTFKKKFHNILMIDLFFI